MSPACIFLDKNSGLDASHRHIARLADLLGNRTTPVRLLPGVSRVGRKIAHFCQPEKNVPNEENTT
jgi:hypothetical protein